MNDDFKKDKQAIILLCCDLGKDHFQKPLSWEEYGVLARWLHNNNRSPRDLFEKENATEVAEGTGIEGKLLESLLKRGGSLGFAMEKWERNGVWVISKRDEGYPVGYTERFKDDAPPLLFGIGDPALLSDCFFGIRGPKEIKRASKNFDCIQEAVSLCSSSGVTVVSGDGRHIDVICEEVAVKSSAVTIKILSGNLLRKSLESTAREAIADKKLLLLSPYPPETIPNDEEAKAASNKLVDAMLNYGLVVSTGNEKGDVWEWAVEELERENPIHIFVQVGKGVPKLHKELLEFGAKEWSAFNFKQQLTNQSPLYQIYQAVLSVILSKLDGSNSSTIEGLAKVLAVNKTQLKAWLKKAVKENELVERLVYVRTGQLQENPVDQNPEVNGFPTVEETSPTEELPVSNVSSQNVEIVKNQDSPSNAYQAILKLMLSKLDNLNSATAEELAKALEVNTAQINAWLKKAEEEKYLTKRLIYVQVNQSQENLGKEKQETLDLNPPSPDIYQAVLPHILPRLDNPIPDKELAKVLGVNTTQLKAWLDRAVKDGAIKKLLKPVRYVRCEPGLLQENYRELNFYLNPST